MSLIERFFSRSRKRMVERVLTGAADASGLLENEDWASLPDILAAIQQQTNAASFALIEHPFPRGYEDPEKFVALGRLRSTHVERLKALGTGVYVALGRTLAQPREGDIRRTAAHMLRLLLAHASHHLPDELLEQLGNAAGDADEAISSEACHALQSLHQHGHDISPALHDLLVALAAAYDVEHMLVLIALLGGLGAKASAASPALTLLLSSSHARVRTATAHALLQIDRAAALDALIDALPDEDAAVRETIMRLLGQIDNRRSEEALISALRDPQLGVRHAATTMLGKIGSPLALTALCDTLHDESEAVRQAGALTLDIMGWQPDQSVHAAAYWVIKRQWEQCIALGAVAVEPLLQTGVLDADLRRAALDTLTTIGMRARAELFDALHRRSLAIRALAMDALAQIAGAQALPTLINALKDPDAKVRQAAEAALECIVDTDAIDLFIATLNDRSPFVREVAARALGRFNDARNAPHLIALLRDTHAEVREAAALALEHSGWQPQPDREGAFFHMTRQHWDHCVAIGAEAVPALMCAAQLDEPARQHALDALWQIGAGAVPPLIEALTDTDTFVRVFAAGALGQFGDARAIEPLIAALQDENHFMRISGAGALGRFNAPRADADLLARSIETLLAALEQEDSLLRNTAADALARLSGQNFAHDNIRWQHWWEIELEKDGYASLLENREQTVLSEERRALVHLTKLLNIQRRSESHSDHEQTEVAQTVQAWQSNDDLDPAQYTNGFEQTGQTLARIRHHLETAIRDLEHVIADSSDARFIARANIILHQAHSTHQTLRADSD